MLQRIAMLPGLLALVVGTLSCDPAPTDTASERRDATFHVVRMDGVDLPSLSPLGECFVLSDGGLLSIYRDGSFSMNVASEVTICGGAPGDRRSLGLTGTYEFGDDHISFRQAGGSWEVVGEYLYGDPVFPETDRLVRKFELVIDGHTYQFEQDNMDRQR